MKCPCLKSYTRWEQGTVDQIIGPWCQSAKTAYGSVIMMRARQCRKAEWGPRHAPTYSATLLVENVSTFEKYRRSHHYTAESLPPPTREHINSPKLAIPAKRKRWATGNGGRIQHWSHTESLRRNVSGARCEEDAGASVWRSTHEISKTQAAESWRPSSPTHLLLSLCNFQEILFPDVPLWRRNRLSKRCIHFYVCLWAFASNENLAREFSCYICPGYAGTTIFLIRII